MPSPADLPWYDRFFQHEYLVFDEHPQTNVEVEFILKTLQPESEDLILDLCCGYGRHLVPLLQKKCAIVGLDRSPVMLRRAQESAERSNLQPALIRADMGALPFVETFQYVLSLFSSFGYFEAEDDNFRVLKEISDALVPGGHFLIETANRDFIVRHLVPTQVYRPEDMLLIEERSFDPVISRSRVDVTILQNNTQTHLYHSIRLYSFTELQMLLNAVGLVPSAVWGDFHGGEYTCNSPHMIVLAEKP